jgi:hypothetical protein
MVHDNQKFRTLDRRTVELLNVITGSGIEYNKEEEVVDMCLAIELMKQEAVENTLILSIHNLMETLNLTAEQAMAALKIPEEERDNYLKQL